MTTQHAESTPYRARTLLASLVAATCLALPTAAQAGRDVDEASKALFGPALDLPLTHKKRKTTGGKLDKKMSPSVRIALNSWAEIIATHDLNVVVPEHAEALVIGTADRDVLIEAAAVLDDTWELLGELTEMAGDEPGPATLAFLFDRDGFRSDAWPGVLEELSARRLIPAAAERGLKEDPGGLTLRQVPLFLQPTYDMAGNAAAGDDEFRLHNELAHKLTVGVLRTRIGEVPASIRWGLGYLSEQRLFQSIYQFDHVGFVSASDHFDWPKRTGKILKDAVKKKRLALAEHALDHTAAGQASTPQLVTWGTLDYLLHKQPGDLHTLLTELAALHDDGSGGLNVPKYAGEVEATSALLEKALADIDPKQLVKHVNRLK